MIEVDGSPGGQVLRNALSYAVMDQRSFRITDIRGSRSNPGLRKQHCTAVEVMQQLSDAEVDGNEVGATELEFVPQGFTPRDVTADIETAGSIALLFQTVMPLCGRTDEAFTVTAEGGTDVKWSPPTAYLEHAAVPLLERFGAALDVKTGRHGFYPDGGGRARLDVEPSDLDETFLEDRGEVRGLSGVSIASQHLRESNVAERQRSEVRRLLGNEYPEHDIDVEARYEQSLSPGSMILLVAEFADGLLAADCLGEKGKRAEQVAKDAADDLFEDITTGAAVDRHMADQVVPFLAQSSGAVYVPEATDHLRTSIGTAERFLDVSFSLEERDGFHELRCE
ncbi:MAG: RNA 3'-terminal phosphate cyclase [Candidatus Nanohaloarchaea archaeon]|nr:RNA 3'-terminal phosphate cyclase [Candidatus Nanohaloarchaea archaeon]